MSWEIYCTDMCRACMKHDGVLLHMYDDKAISGKNLSYKLAELTSIRIDRFDGLPNMLCAKCAYRTNTFYDFKLQVQATEKKLRQMFDKQIYKTEEEILDDEDIEQMDNSFESCSSNDLKSVHSINIKQNSVTEMIDDTNNDEQQLEDNISELDENNQDNIKNKLHLDDVLCDSQAAAIENQADIHSVKTEIPEEIFNSQQLNYTIMYIPESMIGKITDSAENSFTSEPEQEKAENSHDVFIPTMGTLEEENIEILNDSSFVGSKTTIESEHSCQNKNSIQSRDKKMNNGSSTKIKQPSKVEDSDDSDSDYFIDSKDNIFGSLNDTITRIKELKNGNTIEYQCTLCSQNYDKLTGVLLHTINNHVPSSGPFFCVVCEKDCNSHRELRAHAKTHTGQFPYSCFICNKSYAMKRYLKRHMVCHTDFPRYRCPKCGDRFKVKTELESHVKTHKHGAPFVCSQCPRVFNHKGNYKRHLISHLDPQGMLLPKYPCETCGKRFLNNRTLQTHMRSHTGEKPFKCEICNKSFSQQGNLLNHAKIHKNPRSYRCDNCGKRFNQRATLKDHQLLHTGEKPYVCNVCGVAFTFSAALRRHMWLHADGKPFGCDTCGARFVGKYDLRRHMQVHTNQPRVKRKRNAKLKERDPLEQDPLDTEGFKEENFVAADESSTVMMEQVFLPQDVTPVTHQVESEKENVDALFNLIHYN